MTSGCRAVDRSSRRPLSPPGPISDVRWPGISAPAHRSGEFGRTCRGRACARPSPDLTDACPARLDDLEMCAALCRQRLEALDRRHLGAEPREERGDIPLPVPISSIRWPGSTPKATNMSATVRGPSWSGRREAARRRRCVRDRGSGAARRHPSDELHRPQDSNVAGYRAPATTERRTQPRRPLPRRAWPWPAGPMDQAVLVPFPPALGHPYGQSKACA